MQTPPEPVKQLTVFLSYTKEDRELCKELKNHLRLSERLKHIQIVDLLAPRGQTRSTSKLDQLNTADIILLLLSSDFIASDYCYSVETTRAMQRHQAGEARVVPILLRPFDTENAPFFYLQALPLNGTPVTKWDNRDEAFTNISEGIKRIAREFSREHLRAEENIPTQLLDNAANCFARANELMQLKQYQLALQNYDCAIQHGLSPSDCALAYTQKGIALDKLERYDQAVHAYNQALQSPLSDSDHIDVTIKKGWALYRLEQYEQALTVYEELANIHQYDAYELKYYVLCRMKRYSEALDVCEHAIKLNPDLASAYDTKSWALYRLGYNCTDTDEKVRYYQAALIASNQAIDRSSDLTSAYNNKGRAVNQVREYEQALEAYAEAIRLYKQEIAENPLSGYLYHKLATVYNNRGIAHSNLGNYQAALRSYKAAINFYKQAHSTKQQNALPLPAISRRDSNVAAAYKHKGETLFNLKQFSEALADLETAHTMYDAVLKKCEYEDQNTSRDCTIFRDDIAWVCVNLARVHNAYLARNKDQKREHYQKAKEACNKAIRLKLERSIVYSLLGEALKGLGAKKDAERAYNRAKELRAQDK